MYGQGARRPWERQGDSTHLGGLTWRDEEPTKTFRVQSGNFFFCMPNVHHYKCELDYFWFNLVITGNMSLSGGDGGQRRRPCVGLCYYEKLLALAGKNQADKRPNETIQVSV